MKQGKLVRDKIPEIIIADGKKPIIRILDNDEYLQELDKKLNEEIAEYQATSPLKKWRMHLRCCLRFARLGGIPLKNYWKYAIVSEINVEALKRRYFGVVMNNATNNRCTLL